MHMITSTARRPYASTRSEPCLSSAWTSKCMHVKTRPGAWRLSAWLSSRVEWLMNDDGEVEALRSLVKLPWITQQHFVGMLQARGDERSSWCLCPFRMATVLPLRTAWIADILSQAPLRDVQWQRCWKRGSGDGQRLWDYFTARLSDLSMPLTSEVRRAPEPSARPSAAADSEERQICTTCLLAESVGLCLCFLPSCAMCKDNAVGNVVAGTGRDLVSLWLRHDGAIFQCRWKVRFDAHLYSLHSSR